MRYWAEMDKLRCGELAALKEIVRSNRLAAVGMMIAAILSI